MPNWVRRVQKDLRSELYANQIRGREIPISNPVFKKYPIIAI